MNIVTLAVYQMLLSSKKHTKATTSLEDAAKWVKCRRCPDPIVLGAAMYVRIHAVDPGLQCLRHYGASARS